MCIRDRVYGVQAEGAPSMYRSLHEHKYQTLKNVATFADGIQVKTPGELTYQLCEEYVDDIVTVSEMCIRDRAGPLPYPVRAVQLDTDPIDLTTLSSGWPAGAQLKMCIRDRPISYTRRNFSMIFSRKSAVKSSTS